MKRIYHFIFLLLFIPVLSRAQQHQEPVVDTITTSLPDSIASLTDENYEQDEPAAPKKNETVFDPKWMAAPDSVKLREVNAATIKAQKADEEFWYANYSFKKEKPKKDEQKEDNSRPLIDNPALETILWVIVVAGFVTFLAVFLMNGNVGIFRRSKAIREQEMTEENFDDIFSINYEQQIEKAAAAGNFNFGVRLLYLRLLRTLAERNIIEYKQERTNFDYLLQVQPTKYYKDFFRLTRHYEYGWYGQFPMQREQFDQIRRQFADFDRTLN
ncbi:MAG: hypothetical protein DI535_15140 [Citrobacter freundii]|nr:MAG: hypothetical protein DI535_15140 [Citrobacter freundii]